MTDIVGSKGEKDKKKEELLYKDIKNTFTLCGTHESNPKEPGLKLLNVPFKPLKFNHSPQCKLHPQNFLLNLNTKETLMSIIKNVKYLFIYERIAQFYKEL